MEDGMQAGFSKIRDFKSIRTMKDVYFPKKIADFDQKGIVF